MPEVSKYTIPQQMQIIGKLLVPFALNNPPEIGFMDTMRKQIIALSGDADAASKNCTADTAIRPKLLDLYHQCVTLAGEVYNMCVRQDDFTRPIQPHEMVSDRPSRSACEDWWKRWLKTERDIEYWEEIAASGPAGNGDANGPAVDDDASLSAKKLASMFDVPLERLQSRLKRWRKTADKGWIENPDRTSRAAQYLYRIGSIRPIIDSMKSTAMRRS